MWRVGKVFPSAQAMKALGTVSWQDESVGTSSINWLVLGLVALSLVLGGVVVQRDRVIAAQAEQMETMWHTMVPVQP